MELGRGAGLGGDTHHRGRSEIVERLQPILKDRLRFIVAGRDDSAEPARSGVVVVVRGQLEILGLGLHGLAVREVLRHVRLRSEQTLLFAAPQRDAHGPIHFQIQALENPHRFDGYRRAGGIVGGAGTAVPGIQMRAQHHDFVLLAASFDLADHVERIGGRIDELRLNIELQLHGDVVIEQPNYAIVMLWRHHHHGRWNGILGIARSAGLAEDRARVADVPRLQDHYCAFVFEELIHLVAKLGTLLLFGRLRRTERAEEIRQTSRIDGGVQLGVGEPASRRIGGHREIAGLHRQHDLAAQLALELFEIRIVLERRVDGFRLHRALRAGAPGQREPDQRRVRGFDHVAGEVCVGPTAAEGSPRFFVDVGEPVLLQPLDHPVARGLEAGRIGEARTIHVGEIEDVLHHFGVFERLGLDAMNDREVDGFFGVGGEGREA